MCILFVFTDPTPSPNAFRLIVASNRDEYYRRPAEPIERNADVIAGRDMEPRLEGGMWLGLSLKRTENFKIRVAALLNVTGAERTQHSKGRGCVVADYLTGGDDVLNYFEKVESTFNPYNFVAVELDDHKAITSHHSNSPEGSRSYSGKQFLGFGNSPLETPLTKVTNGIERFKKIVEEGDANRREELRFNLLELLKWEDRHLPDPELERRRPEVFEHLSSIFVSIPSAGYGTRAHSLIFVDYDWNVEFYESAMEQPIDPERPEWAARTIKARL